MVRALPVKALVIMSTMAANQRAGSPALAPGGFGMRPPSSRVGVIGVTGRRLTSGKGLAPGRRQQPLPPGSANPRAANRPWINKLLRRAGDDSVVRWVHFYGADKNRLAFQAGPWY
jgi:hypothetical protein